MIQRDLVTDHRRLDAIEKKGTKIGRNSESPCQSSVCNRYVNNLSVSHNKLDPLNNTTSNGTELNIYNMKRNSSTKDPRFFTRTCCRPPIHHRKLPCRPHPNHPPPLPPCLTQRLHRTVSEKAIIPTVQDGAQACRNSNSFRRQRHIKL